MAAHRTYTITGIENQKRRKGRVNVYLNDQFWSGMSLDLAQELNLSEGQQLSKADIKHYEERVLAREALDYCLRRLSMRRSSSGQLSDKLEQRGYSEQVIEQTMNRLEELLLIDDQQYANDLINQRLNKGQWGLRISQALDKAGIDKDVAKRLLAARLAKEDESSRVEAALLKRYPDPLDANDRRKAQGFLARRGFSSAISRQVILAHAMDPSEEAEIYNEEAARALLERKGRTPGKDRASRQKAFNFLLRRGFSSQVIEQALR